MGVTGSRDLSLGPAGVSKVYKELFYYLGCRRSICTRTVSTVPIMNTLMGMSRTGKGMVRMGPLLRRMEVRFGSGAVGMYRGSRIGILRRPGGYNKYKDLESRKLSRTALERLGGLRSWLWVVEK